MAIDKLINSTQGDSMVAQLTAIKTNLQNLASVSLEKLGMGVAVCDTSASTAAKTATLVNYKLNDGGLIAIKFTNANTASSATLNINNTGAKNIYYKGSAIGTDVIKAGDTAIFMYSTNYHLITIDRWGSEIPKATSTAPAMDTGSTGTVGTSTEYARADHKHPSDSTKQDTVAFYTTYNASTNKAATMTDITNSAQSGTLTGYAKKTGNVSGSDDIATAIGKLETKADNNTSNILTVSDSGGAKNIINHTATSGSATGLTWTVNSDKSITVQVTGTHAKKDIVLQTFANGVGDNMVLSGCPSGGNISTGYALYAANGTTAAVVASDTGNGATLSYNSIMFVSIVINADVPNGTYTFKPMICTKSLWDISHKYEPYAMSNVELTNDISTIQTDLTKTVMKGDTYVANTTKTYTLTAAKTYLISVVCYNVAGLFLAFKYSTESTPRLFPVYKTADFDNYVTVSAVANSSNIEISSASSSTWYYSNIAML